MQISIPDDLYAKYQDAAKQARKPTGALLIQQLDRFVDAPPTRRAIILSGESLEEIDRLLGAGSTLSAEALIQAVKRWAGISIGDIRLHFSPAQLQEIAIRAKKQGKSPEAVCQDIVDQLAHEFFYQPVVRR